MDPHRTRELTVTVREDDTTPGTVRVLAVPTGETLSMWGGLFHEEISTSVTVRMRDAQSLPMMWRHDEVIGSWSKDITYSPAGLEMSGRVSDTTLGRDVLTLLRDGASTGASIGFRVLASHQETRDSVTVDVIDEMELLEVSLTPIPAYAGAAVLSVREHTPQEEPTMADTAAPAPVDERTVDVSPIVTRLDQLEARMASGLTVHEPPPPVDVRAAFTNLVRSYGQDRRTRALADMVSADNTGLTDPGRTSMEIIDYIDSMRYFIAEAGASPFPPSGIVSTYPRITQHTQVGAGTGEKTEAPSQAVESDTVNFTGVWYKGALDISYELIRTSTPGAVQVAVESMLTQAALHSEGVFVAAVEAGATASGAVIDFTDYGTFVASVRPQVAAIRKATGVNAPKLALTEDSFTDLLSLLDADGRRILASQGPSNADGTSLLTDQRVNVAGVVCFESPESTVDVMFNTKALRKAELPPVQLATDNVALMGRDVGILGNIITELVYPAGIVAFTA